MNYISLLCQGYYYNIIGPDVSVVSRANTTRSSDQYN